MEQMLLTSEAARELEVSAATIRNLEARGVLPAIKTPTGTRLFRRSDVKKLAEERKEKAAEVAS